MFARQQDLGGRTVLFALCIAAMMLGARPALPQPARAQSPQPPRVVVSIKPLHSLVAAVMADIARPHLLLPPGASPHAYALKPSDARALTGADMIVWIGPGLESFLVKPIRTLGGKAWSIALAEAKGMIRHRRRDSGVWRTQTHDHDGDDRDDDDRAGHALDPHLWLDPENARRIARLTARHLAEADPVRGGRYAANLDRTLAEIDRAEAETRVLLAPVVSAPYVVFHDAFQYFEKRFATAAIGAVTVSPGRQPGARRIARIRAPIADGGVRCVFTEPQFEPALVRTLLRGTGVRAGIIDPMGSGTETYGGMLRAIALSMRRCLGSLL